MQTAREGMPAGDGMSAGDFVPAGDLMPALEFMPAMALMTLQAEMEALAALLPGLIPAAGAVWHPSPKAADDVAVEAQFDNMPV